MKKRLSILIIMVLTLVLVTPVNANAIMFGHKERDESKIPAQATVELSNCTGILVKPEWILTAKHCEIENNSTVRIGLRGAKEKKTVRKVIDNPNVDVSLVKLSSPSHRAQPVSIYNTNKKLPVGTKTTAYGWGMTGFIYTWWLRKSQGEIVDNSPSFGLVPKRQGVTNRLNGWSKIMPGDSGGPLFVNNKLYGIVSGGGLANNVKTPFRNSWDFVNNMRAIKTPTETVYSPVNSFTPWMNNIIEKY